MLLVRLAIDIGLESDEAKGDFWLYRVQPPAGVPALSRPIDDPGDPLCFGFDEALRYGAWGPPE